MTLRSRILATVAAATLLIAGVHFWWGSGLLRSQLREGLTAEMEREARLISRQIGDRPFTDSLADRFGGVVGHRVTLVGEGGGVRGDSEVAAGRVPDLESQRDRPEIRAALRGDVGTASRVSRTVARSLLYVAVPHPAGGAVRVAAPTSRLGEPVARFRRVVVASGAAVLLLALAAAGRLERFVAAPVRRVRRALSGLAAGDHSVRIRPDGDDEPARLARAADRLGARLERMGEELREQRELEEVFGEMEEGVAVVDADGRVTRANEAFLELVGREDAVGERFGTLFRNPAPRELVDRGLGGESASRETELGERSVLFSVRPRGEGAVVTTRDLTRVRRLEGVRRDFVANVSHELKTPLTSVLGFAEALADSEVSPERAREFGRRILSNGVRMRRMIDELMDLSRVESGAWEPEPREVPLAEAARSAWQAVADEGRGVRLEVEIDDELAVHADRDALRSVLRNLLSNAVRYSPGGEAVTVSARRTDGAVRTEVRDRGPGIPTAHLDRVFERFYRVDAGRSRDEGGTGLGLSIVKHLVEAHGGAVGVESRVGEGTVFWFELPGAGGGEPPS